MQPSLKSSVGCPEECPELGTQKQTLIDPYAGPETITSQLEAWRKHEYNTNMVLVYTEEVL